MDFDPKAIITKLLIVIFLFFSVSADPILTNKKESQGLQLITEAEKLFLEYDYPGSIKKFNEAVKFMKIDSDIPLLFVISNR